MNHTHPPLHMFHHYIYQTPAMYQICHHHLSDTHYLSDLTSLFIRHMLHFRRSIPITIYTLSSRAPTHRYLHAFLCLHTLHTPLKSGSNSNTSNNIDVDGNLHPSCAKNPRSMAQTSQHANPVSCQLSAVSCQLSFISHKGSRLWGVSTAPKTPLFARFLYYGYH